MITQSQLEQLRIEVSHTSPDAMHKINAAVLADALTELWCWRNGGVTEEMLRAKDGCIKIGRGCIIARECDWPGAKPGDIPASDEPPDGCVCPAPYARWRVWHPEADALGLEAPPVPDLRRGPC